MDKKGTGHQKRRRVIGGVRVDEQEYPDGSVAVFVNFEQVDETFEKACERAESSQGKAPAKPSLWQRIRSALGKGAEHG